MFLKSFATEIFWLEYEDTPLYDTLRGILKSKRRKIQRSHQASIEREVLSDNNFPRVELIRCTTEESLNDPKNKIRLNRYKSLASVHKNHAKLNIMR